MKRALAVLSLVGVMAIPFVAVAQSPEPEVVARWYCVDVQAAPGDLTAEQLQAGIADGSITIVAIEDCAPTSASPDASAGPTTGPEVEYDKLSNRAWAKLMKNPDDTDLFFVQVWACITQFDEATTGLDTFRGQAYNKKTDYWFSDGDNAIFSGTEELFDDFVEEDIVSMEALVGGTLEYETTLDETLKVPVFLVQSIKRRGSCE